MKIPLTDIQVLYSNLIEEINVAEMSVIMFTALDIDALCSLKIFSKLLQSENIEYKVYPVSTYTELEKSMEEARIYEETIRLFLFINCGGIIDLTEQWFAKDPNSQILLLDMHKPIVHTNIESNNIKVIDDSNCGFDLAPTSYEYEIFQQYNEADLEQEEEGAGEDSDEDIGPKRRRGKNAEINKNEKIRKYRNLIGEKISKYYDQQFFSLPSSYLIYRLIKELNKNNNQYLWYAIVGLTGMLLEQKISKENFETINELYRSDMSKFNSKKEKGQKGSLKRKLDFQFTLMRHWSLYESVMNSSYMVSKFNLWDQNGIDKFHQFLHLIGISLSEAKQLFKFMPKETVEKLETRIFTYAENPRFNLLDIAFESFGKQVDYCVEFMASDYYYALISVLQRPQKTNISFQDLTEHRVGNFWDAYELFQGSQSMLMHQINECKKLITIMIRQSKSILERNHIMNGKSFSFVNIVCDNMQRKIFEHPYTLIRMAYILMQMNKEKKKWKNFKPFIASLQNKETNRTMMVGVMMENKNTFFSKFNTVVSSLEIQAKLDSFMGNIMILPKQMMVKVIRELGQL